MQCRVCGHPLFGEPLLQLANMPAQAQNMPTEQTLADDHGVDLTLCQCSGCGLVQLSNPPVDYYKDVIRAAAFSEEMRGFRLEQFSDLAHRFDLVGAPVLEVGCGSGEYLTLMRDVGMKPVGLEHESGAVGRARDMGLVVEQGYLDDAEQEVAGGPFSAVFTHNFLEHFPDPNIGLRAMWHNLAPGGVLVAEVPNLDMIFEKRLFSEFIGDHLLYFTTETLTRTLAFNGFEVLECQPVWHDYVLSAVARKRAPLDLRNVDGFQEELRSGLLNFVRRFDTVAVWGAGHQSLAVLALAELGGHVRYVVDSAPFKQGCFTPATHVPIVSPETLRIDPVEAIIVMAASYSDEVVGILQGDFGESEMVVAVLRETGLDINPA